MRRPTGEEPGQGHTPRYLVTVRVRGVQSSWKEGWVHVCRSVLLRESEAWHCTARRQVLWNALVTLGRRLRGGPQATR